jgi:hypothetical protein
MSPNATNASAEERLRDLGIDLALAAARAHLRSLDRVTRVVRLAVSLVTTPEFREHARVADAASAHFPIYGNQVAEIRI